MAERPSFLPLTPAQFRTNLLSIIKTINESGPDVSLPEEKLISVILNALLSILCSQIVSSAHLVGTEGNSDTSSLLSNLFKLCTFACKTCSEFVNVNRASCAKILLANVKAMDCCFELLQLQLDPIIFGEDCVCECKQVETVLSDAFTVFKETLIEIANAQMNVEILRANCSRISKVSTAIFEIGNELGLNTFNKILPDSHLAVFSASALNFFSHMQFLVVTTTKPDGMQAFNSLSLVGNVGHIPAFLEQTSTQPIKPKKPGKMLIADPSITKIDTFVPQMTNTSTTFTNTNISTSHISSNNQTTSQSLTQTHIQNAPTRSNSSASVSSTPLNNSSNNTQSHPSNQSSDHNKKKTLSFRSLKSKIIEPKKEQPGKQSYFAPKPHTLVASVSDKAASEKHLVNGVLINNEWRLQCYNNMIEILNDEFTTFSQRWSSLPQQERVKTSLNIVQQLTNAEQRLRPSVFYKGALEKKKKKSLTTSIKGLAKTTKTKFNQVTASPQPPPKVQAKPLYVSTGNEKINIFEFSSINTNREVTYNTVVTSSGTFFDPKTHNTIVLRECVTNILNEFQKLFPEFATEYAGLSLLQKSHVSSSMYSAFTSSITYGSEFVASQEMISQEVNKRIHITNPQLLGTLFIPFVLKKLESYNARFNITRVAQTIDILFRFSSTIAANATDCLLKRKDYQFAQKLLNSIEVETTNILHALSALSIGAKDFYFEKSSMMKLEHAQALSLTLKILPCWDRALLPSLERCFRELGEVDKFLICNTTKSNFAFGVKSLVNQIKTKFNEFICSIQNIVTQLLLVDATRVDEYGLLIQLSRVSFLPSMSFAIASPIRKIISLLKTVIEITRMEDSLESDDVDEDTMTFCDIEGQKMNVWDDKDVPLYDEEGSFKAGSINHLVTKVTDDTNIDSRYVDAFLLSFESFCSPEQLIDKLVERYNVPDSYSQKKTVIQQRVCVILLQWLTDTNHPWNNSLLVKLGNFIKQLSSDGYSSICTKLIPLVKTKYLELQQQVNIQHLPFRLNISAEAFVFQIFQKSSPREVAEQLSIIDYEMFSRLRPTEFFNQNWSREKAKSKAPNILAIVDRSTRFSCWVAWTILAHFDVERRWKFISKFIKIALCLYDIGNFNSLMSVLSGLNLGCILRLKHTYAELDPALKEKFDFLNTEMSNSQSFKKYRSNIRSRIEFCLPFLGITLTDLTFIDDGNKDFSTYNNRQYINFRKREMVSNVLNDLLICQQHRNPYVSSEPLQSMLRSLPHIDPKDNDTLYDISENLEPRGCSLTDII